MPGKISIICSIIAILCLSTTALASSNSATSAVDSYLLSYNISSSTISSLSAINLTLSGHSYVALYNSTSLFLLINVSSQHYSVTTNSTVIANVVQNYTYSKGLSQLNIAQLEANMHVYEDSAAKNITDCNIQTGLSSGLSCTAANSCAACGASALCSYAVREGVSTAFLFPSIEQYENATAHLKSNYSAFYSNLSATNSSNVAIKLPLAIASFQSIDNITSTMQKNRIFPVNLSVSYLQSACTGYMNINNAPWYCTDSPICEVLPFNQSILASLRAQISSISSVPITRQQVLQIAAQASANAQRLIYPIEVAQKKAQLDAMLNTTLANYSTAAATSRSILLHEPNQSLSISLAAMQASYANLTANYLSQNLTKQQSSLGLEYKNFLMIYYAQKAKYDLVASEANNNTYLLVGAQLNNNYNAQLASYAFEELHYNNLVFDKITNYSSVQFGLARINSYARANANAALSPAPLMLGIYAPFSRLLTYSLSLPYSSSLSFAPSAGAVLTLIVGLVIVALLALYYNGLKKHRRLAMSKRTSRNWVFVFLIFFAIILVLSYATYAYFSSFHSTLSMFDSAVQGSGTVAIVTNGTSPSPATSLCISNVTAQLKKMNKKVALYTISSGVCKSISSTSTSDACLNELAYANTPAILLSSGSGSNDSISTYSFYGTSLAVHGDESFMSQCYVSKLI